MFLVVRWFYSVDFKVSVLKRFFELKWNECNDFKVIFWDFEIS